MIDLKLNKIGKIIKGDNAGWYVKVEQDSNCTGSYYIYEFKNKNGNNKWGEAYDNWVESLNDVRGYFYESEWDILWEEE